MIDLDKYMPLLYKLVLKSYKNGEIPVGSIVIYNDKVIGKGYNTRQSSYNVCGHAEINAIKQAEKSLKDWRLDNCILVSTLKPCNMCSSVINESRIDKVYYLFDQDGIINNNFIKIDSNSEYKNKINELFNDFFKKMRG